jgi:hypothetical protein
MTLFTDGYLDIQTHPMPSAFPSEQSTASGKLHPPRTDGKYFPMQDVLRFFSGGEFPLKFLAGK